MNKVILVGRLTRDMEVSHKENGTVVAQGSLAVNRRYTKEDAEQTADFPRIVAFGKTAEFLEKYGKKGVKFLVEGRLQTGNYVNNEGNTVYTTDVIIERVEFAESKKSEDNSAAVTDDGEYNLYN